MKKGPFEVTSSKIVYKNPWIEVREEEVINENNEKGLYGVVDYGSGISVIALDNDNNVYLVKEYYYAIEKYGLQLPSGAIDKGESPIEAAKRELREETGITAEIWEDLGFINPLTMAIKSPAYLFLAKNLTFGSKTEKDIEIIKLKFDQVYQMVMESKITHGPSCVAILKKKNYLDKSST